MIVDNIKNITVIGAGDMGHGIAENALLAGLTVYLTDVKEEQLLRGIENIDKSLHRMGSQGKISQDKIEMCKRNLHSP